MYVLREVRKYIASARCTGLSRTYFACANDQKFYAQTIKTNMAARVKREIKAPKRLINEVNPLKAVADEGRIPKRQKDNRLYEIESKEVDKEGKRVKIHCNGFSDKFDEWRPYDGDKFPIMRLEHKCKPSMESIDDRLHLFQDRLYREVKRKLYSGRKDDPEIRIEISVEEVFEVSIATAARAKRERNKQVYRICNHDLDSFLGVKWDERILNENSDYAFVTEGAVRFWITERNPIIEYKLIGGKYVRSEIEDDRQLVFTFVCGDGNRHQYLTRDDC
ncbi:hypothetical protein AWC38_SpisGene11080 [Stylophora pistillata]|uniref:Uncharacterized protein n=1 Tax=Stylophora pistillata TaxID=50429 RepID=A0A2B4S6U5_STYPI|nr:hypothetical protein AWC38_SpisGene11080 [Stylophora pistillata]